MFINNISIDTNKSNNNLEIFNTIKNVAEGVKYGVGEPISIALNNLSKQNLEFYKDNIDLLSKFIKKIVLSQLNDQKSIVSLAKILANCSLLDSSMTYNLIRESISKSNSQLALQLLESNIDFSQDQEVMNKPKPSPSNKTLLQYACANHMYDVARKLIEKGVNPNQKLANGFSTINAIKLNSEEALTFAKELITKWGASIDHEYRGNTIISQWMSNGYGKNANEVLKLFLREDQAHLLDAIFKKIPRDIEKNAIYKLWGDWVSKDPGQKVDELMAIHHEGNADRSPFMSFLCVAAYDLNVAKAKTDPFFQRIQSKALLDGKLQRSIIKFLTLLGSTKELELAEKQRIVRLFANNKNHKSLVRTLELTTSLLRLNPEKIKEINSQSTDILELLSNVAIEKISLSQSDIENKIASIKFIEKFGNSRGLEALCIWIGQLHKFSENNPDHLQLEIFLKDFISSVLNENYPSVRYQGSVHLDRIFADRENLFQEWKRGKSLELQDFAEEQQLILGDDLKKKKNWARFKCR